MDTSIDYSTYTLDELYQAAGSIDREQYPERAQRIDALIRQKQDTLPETTEDELSEQDLASRRERLSAAIIDGLIGIFTTIPMLFYVGIDALQSPSLGLLSGIVVYGICATLIIHGYLLHYYAQTVGKHFMSIRIENLDGSQATLATILFKRMLPMQIVSLIPGIGQILVGFVDPLFIFTKQRRCVHDYIANTRVANVKEQ